MTSYDRRITLVRHGPPTVSLTEWVAGRSLCDFIDRYNQAGIAVRSEPPPASLSAIASADVVLTSDYRRTIESAKRLGLSIQSSSPGFREVDCWRNFPWPLPKPSWVWLLLTRFLWPLGLIQAPESYDQAKSRAQRCAKTLMVEVQHHLHIVLVGHGGMNTLIARELMNLGWEGPKQPQLSHWAATTYVYPENVPLTIENRSLTAEV